MCGGSFLTSGVSCQRAQIKAVFEILSSHDHEHLHAPFAKHVRAACKSRDSFIEAVTNTKAKLVHSHTTPPNSKTATQGK